MPRYYLSNLTQNAKRQWRPVILNSEAWGAEENPSLNSLTSNFTNGQPDVPWSLCTVFAENHEALGEVQGVDLLPDYPVDGLLSEMGQQIFDDMRSALLAREEITAEAIDGATTFLDILTTIAVDVLGATGFDPESFAG